jgi:hypothetical protein
MSSARDRIAAAVEGKPDADTRVEIGEDGKPFVVETHSFAPVLAGDVVEVVAALGGRADANAKALASGAAGARPDQIVYQRADQLRAVLAMLTPGG